MILNDLAAESTFPFDLGGWTIDRASTEEMNLIRPPMQALSQLATHNAPKFEASIETLYEGQGAFYDFSLSADAWRYTVVRAGSEHMDERHKLTQALRISPLDLRIGGWADWQEDPQSAEVNFDFAETGHYLSRIWSTDPTPVIADFTRSREIYELRCAFDDEKFPEITRALALFEQLDQLEDVIAAKLLGHFTVLESLLSHAPDKYDPVDSITRQLKRNLVLLDHRMPPNENLELDQFGKNATGEQVISNLYSIRSAAAHGGSNEQVVKWLNERTPSGWSWSDNISGYVRKLTQRVLVAALREPQLVSDLRGT